MTRCARLLLFALSPCYSFAQVTPEYQQPFTQSLPGPRKDTSFKIVQVTQAAPDKTPAYFINGTMVEGSTLSLINPAKIKEVRVEKEVVKFNGIQYNGKISLNLTEGIKLITISELLRKHVKTINNKRFIVSIDGVILDEEYDKVYVDESYLLRLFIKELKKPKEKLDIRIIELLTKTPGNIQKVNEVRIRGNNQFTISGKQALSGRLYDASVAALAN